ncbi:MAG: hypothetical protein GXX84_17450 [Acidobacteria bacterium]|nr:hypothetical protein [Acidobacteriota bacterium]
MANESLNDLFEGIEATEAEMERYRARLAQRLTQPRRSRFILPVGMAAAAAFALLLFILAPRHDEFSQPTLEQVRNLAIHKSPDRISVARKLAESDQSNVRWNAIMFLTLTESGDTALQYAVRGILEDPRPEFRAAYLEYFLDAEDHHRFSMREIELMMDLEYDSTCLYLFQKLMQVTQMQEQFLGPVTGQDEG